MKVKVDAVYVYEPVPWDGFDPQTKLSPGDLCRVVNMPCCPPANTNGCCYVADMAGKFQGLVSTNSLRKPTKQERKQNAADAIASR